jgi:hypothetical protein
MTWSTSQRPFYSVGGEPEDGDDASGDEVGVCVPRHGPATDCLLVVGYFLLQVAVGMETNISLRSMHDRRNFSDWTMDRRFCGDLSLVGDDRDTLILG